jgi:prolyl-tRNA editing enzyme YbaK/EbsC (Cys-tRNA(Pro) deacylase)
VLELPRILINGGRRGYLLGIAPRLLIELLGAKPVACALATASNSPQPKR